MSLFSRLAAALRPPAPAERLREAAGVTVDADEDGWRALTGGKRDLAPVAQQRAREISVYLWRQNALGSWLVDVQVAFLLAEGVRLQVQDEEAQSWLDAFWGDPINNLDVKLPKKVRELSLYGEQCWPVFVAPNGLVRLGTIDPASITEVIHDPDNGEQPIGVVVRRQTGDPETWRVIVNGPETIFTPRTRALRESFGVGECFYWRINDLSGASRGTPDLLAVADWLDAYDQGLWSELSRWEELRAFLWDIAIAGATPEQVEERARKIAPPAPGSTRVHNDAETWTAVTPDLKANDGAGFARLIRNHILGSRGIPEHWFGGGGDVNRATAAEMDEPTLKLLSMRQQVIGAILQQLGTYVVRQRVLAIIGVEPEQYDAQRYRVECVWPEMAATDISKYAAALQQVAAAAALLVQRGLIPEETAVALIAAIAGRLGVEIDPAEALAAARAEAATRAAEDLYDQVDEDPAGPGQSPAPPAA